MNILFSRKKAASFILIILILLELLAFTNVVMAQQDKNIVFKKLQKKYGNAESILIIFSNDETMRGNGTIKAKKTNKFHIVVEGRKIVCDGKTLWNYNPTKKNVIISEFSDELAGITLDYFFFNAFDNLRPDVLKSELSSSTKKNYILSLVPEKNSKMLDITSVDLYLNNNFDTIKAIKINNSGGSQKWIIKNIKINPKINNTEFIFKIPEQTEIIDYR